jgi:Group 4 capsule polysaccharide lipoprotein gfcB, YjbF
VRLLIFMFTGLLLQGCTVSQQSMVETFRTAATGDRDITLPDAQIQSLPYSSMYLRLNEGQQIFVVLGYIEAGQSKWLTQDHAMIVTRNGRLLKTTGLRSNLLDVTDAQQDPLNQGLTLREGMRWTRVIRWSEEGRSRSATLTSQFSSAGDVTINVAGKPIHSRIWHENVQSDRPDRGWQNTFWMDKSTGQIRRSQQMLGAGVMPVEMTILKPAP